MLTLHFGSIELAMLTLPLAGIPLTVVGRPLPNPWIRRHMAQQRTRTGAQLLEHHDVAPRILDALRRGRTVAFLNDQYARRTGGILSPFFGARCFTAPGIALLALRSGAPVLPCYIVREGPDRHRASCFRSSSCTAPATCAATSPRRPPAPTRSWKASSASTPSSGYGHTGASGAAPTSRRISMRSEPWPTAGTATPPGPCAGGPKPGSRGS